MFLALPACLGQGVEVLYAGTGADGRIGPSACAWQRQAGGNILTVLRGGVWLWCHSRSRDRSSKSRDRSSRSRARSGSRDRGDDVVVDELGREVRADRGSSSHRHSSRGDRRRSRERSHDRRGDPRDRRRHDSHRHGRDDRRDGRRDDRRDDRRRYDDRRGGHGSQDRRGREETKRAPEPKPEPEPELDTTGMTEEEIMMKMMGISGFDSTKVCHSSAPACMLVSVPRTLFMRCAVVQGKVVEDNHASAARGASSKKKKREYRQYMNVVRKLGMWASAWSVPACQEPRELTLCAWRMLCMQARFDGSIAARAAASASLPTKHPKVVVGRWLVSSGGGGSSAILCTPSLAFINPCDASTSTSIGTSTRTSTSTGLSHVPLVRHGGCTDVVGSGQQSFLPPVEGGSVEASARSIK